MKVTIQFDLPKERDDHEVFMSGYSLLAALRELKQFISISPEEFEMDRQEKRYFTIMTDAFNAIVQKHGVKGLIK